MKQFLTYNHIKSHFNDLNWNSDLITNCNLERSDKKKSIDYIVSQLKSKESSIRYIASTMISKFEIQDAKEGLIERILDKDTLNSNGSMVFALEELNCQNSLVGVFKILASQSYESKCHAYNILSEQEFEFTNSDLIEIKEIFEKVTQNRTENQIFDDETFEMIKDIYEGFNEYLLV